MVERSPRNVLLTGASTGIGAALAIELARRGDRLALVARRAGMLEETAERAREAAAAAGVDAPWVRCFPADVTDAQRIRDVVAEVEGHVGPVDLLVLNAGIGQTERVENYEPGLAARILEVNLVSAVWAIGAVMPGMIARRSGHIVGISSIAAYRGLPGASSYCASKAGLSTLLESLRLDLHRHAVAVTTVSPGFVRTPMTAKNRHPMPFMVEPEAAAQRIARGIDRRKREVRFPWPLVLAMRVLRAMPDRLYDLLLRRVDRPSSRKPLTEPF